PLENIEELWERVLLEIEKKVSKPSYETWLKATKANDIENNSITISAPNEFARDWLEEHYTGLASDTIEQLTGARLIPKFVIPNHKFEDDFPFDPPPKTKSKAESTVSTPPRKSMLNDKYTFNTFVIGSGNRFAHAASLAVA